MKKAPYVSYHSLTSADL